jgi:glycosyltransferase involved in cell wall biosynthesis
MAAPEISVVVPCYNAARYLESAIASLQTQTFSDFEIIAVDDGSKDNTKAILETLAARDARLRIISRPNTGIVGALNDGIAAARGEFIARMDADDLCLPTRFENQIAFLRAHPDCVALGTSVIFMDADSYSVKRVPRETSSEKIEAALLAGDGGALIHPTVTLRKSAVDQVGRYRKEAQYVEDVDLFLRLARIGKLANLPSYGLRYRVHPQSINFTKNAGRFQLLQRVLGEAHAARNQPFTPKIPTAEPEKSWSSIVDIHREWAATSLEFGSRRVAVSHALRACRIEPFARSSWRALRYALNGPLPSAPATP